LSGNQEFIIKINDIIGKSWLASLDDSEGYVLSLKPIDQDSLSPVSEEKEQEEITTVTETSSQKIEVSENEKKAPRWNNNSPALGDIRRNFMSYFKEESQKFPSFVEAVNVYTANTRIGILPIEYEKLGISKNAKERENENKNNSISGKIEDLIKKFDCPNRLSYLNEIFLNFKNSNL
jgi:hypothetical protein